MAVLLLAGCGLQPPPRAELPRDAGPPPACQPIHGMAGAEDITVDAERGLAYVSSTDRRALLHGDQPVSPDGHIGHLYRLELEADPPRAWDVTPTSLRDGRFAPHGISLLVAPDGTRRLFVINHGARYDAAARRWRQGDAASRIEIMPFPASASGEEPLGLEAPVTDPLLVSPNDIAAVGPRAFYATNEHGQPPGLEANLRDLFGLNDGFLVYHDGTSARRVLALPWANGVQVDPAGRRVFVASSSLGTITTLRWQDHHPASPSDPPLRLGSGADNIEIDPTTGELLVAAHPSPARLAALLFRWVRTAQSQVIRVAPDAGAALEVLRLAGDERQSGEIAAASVAAAYRRRDGRDLLLIGSVFSRFVLLCSPSPQRSRETG